MGGSRYQPIFFWPDSKLLAVGCANAAVGVLLVAFNLLGDQAEPSIYAAALTVFSQGALMIALPRGVWISLAAQVFLAVVSVVAFAAAGRWFLLPLCWAVVTGIEATAFGRLRARATEAERARSVV